MMPEDDYECLCVHLFSIHTKQANGFYICWGDPLDPELTLCPCNKPIRAKISRPVTPDESAETEGFVNPLKEKHNA